MSFFSQSPYRHLYLYGLLVIVITAWFSVGYNHPDEHFQVLEFCNYKMGFSPASDLAWEFKAQSRPAIQPFLAYCCCKTLFVLGWYNPFMAAFLLRLASGVLAWWVICRLITQLLPDFKTDRGKKLFVLCSLFLWYIPYISVRFCAENIAGILLFLSISFLLELPNQSVSKKMVKLVFVGLFFGLMLFIRAQSVFALVGLGIWLLFIQKLYLRYWLVMVMAALVAIGLCVCIDYWFYGVWLLSPYNYFHAQIVQNIAANWGVSPWWYYFVLFIQMAIPPLSIVLLALFLVGICKKPLSVFSIVAICFMIGHFMIGHKEMRYLFPVSFAFIYLACIGLDALITKYADKRIYKWGFNLLVVINMGALVFRMFAPSQEAIKYFDFLYGYTQKQVATLVYFNTSPYHLVNVEQDFYKPKNLRIKHIDDTAQLAQLIKSTPKEEPILYLSPEIKPDSVLNNYKLQKMYCLFPNWLLQYNINNWQDRSHIWTIYRVSN